MMISDESIKDKVSHVRPLRKIFDADVLARSMSSQLNERAQFEEPEIVRFIAALKELPRVNRVSLLKTAKNFSPFIKAFCRELVTNPLTRVTLFPTSTVSVTVLENTLRWYHFRYTQRSMLMLYSQDDDLISLDDMDLLMEQEILQHLDSSVGEVEHQCFGVMLCVGFTFYFGSQQKIGIQSLLDSDLMFELFNARMINDHPRDDYLAPNWFAIHNCHFILSEYRRCDLSKLGLLRKQDVRQMYSGIFNPVFTDGIFRTVEVYPSEPDANNKTEPVLDFKLFALVHRHILNVSSIYKGRNANTSEKPAMEFIFNCLDIQGKGYLTRGDVTAIMTEILNICTEQFDIQSVEIDSLTNEIFDMVNPVEKERITVTDIYESRMGNLILGMMIDAVCFNDYELRESH